MIFSQGCINSLAVHGRSLDNYEGVFLNCGSSASFNVARVFWTTRVTAMRDNERIRTSFVVALSNTPVKSRRCGNSDRRQVENALKELSIVHDPAADSTGELEDREMGRPSNSVIPDLQVRSQPLESTVTDPGPIQVQHSTKSDENQFKPVKNWRNQLYMCCERYVGHKWRYCDAGGMTQTREQIAKRQRSAVGSTEERAVVPFISSIKKQKGIKDVRKVRNQVNEFREKGKKRKANLERERAWKSVNMKKKTGKNRGDARCHLPQQHPFFPAPADAALTPMKAVISGCRTPHRVEARYGSVAVMGNEAERGEVDDSDALTRENGASQCGWQQAELMKRVVVN
ncbi:hypothetical protein B0H14DRAFT_2599769 [Mycena olivaceomarginata]|nr:hypothetical protein B0H14DRAFT_2599769 [Mycena olivaceomarginata]